MHFYWGKLYKGTVSELAIEPAIASLGLVYRNQFPGFLYGFRFFVDFLLPQLKLVIEIDDPSHNTRAGREKDAARTAQLERDYGWTVVRCTNEEAETDPFGAVSRMLGEAGVTKSKLAMAKRRPVELPIPKKIRRAEVVAARKAAAGPNPNAKRRRRKATSPPPAPMFESDLEHPLDGRI